MKTTKKAIVTLLTVLCMVVCTACTSFDTSGYVKAVLDNSIKGDSAAMVEFTKASAEDVTALYDEEIQSNIDVLLEGATISDELTEEFRSVVIDLLKQTRYEVGESTKNSDGTYTVPVKVSTLTLNVTSQIEEKTTAYVNEIQDAVANGSEMPSEDEIMEQIYTTTLECLKESMQNITYSDPVEYTVTVSIENKLYTPDQSDLDELSTHLIDVE